jgi:HlyD family secretion protein
MLLTAIVAAGCRNEPPPPVAAGPQGPAASQRVQPQKGAIGSLGRIEPGDGIVRVSARGLSGQPAIVGRVLVKEGDRVTSGQVLAELDTREQLEAAVSQAAARIEVARRHLAQVQAGAKASDVAAQQADVERIQSELSNAEAEYKRHASLGTNTTASELERLKLRVDSATRSLAAAKDRLASLTEVRPVDVERRRPSSMRRSATKRGRGRS